MILTCPTCGSKAKAPEDAASRKVKCRRCGVAFQVAGPVVPPAVRVRPPDSQAEHRSDAEGEAERTQCPYCSEIILTTARKCKHCGEILDAELRESRVQTIEQTGKRWKAVQFVGALVMLAGVICVLVACAGNLPVAVLVLGAVLATCGIVTFIIGRVGGWWFHG
jgi:DNA-directed RNA polymerase subunit M/transcription elongation factor TFIIS